MKYLAVPLSLKNIQSEDQLPQYKKNDSDKSTTFGSYVDLQIDLQDNFQQDGFFGKSFKKIKSRVSSIDMNIIKFSSYGGTTSRADKVARLCTSLIKIAKAYQWISYTSNKPGINKLNKQLSLSRKVFQFNSKWQSLKQLIQQIPAAKTKLDYFNILFTVFQFVSSVNDFFLVLMQIKALLVKDYIEDKIDMLSSDFYFIQCLVHLCLHTFEYIKMRRKIKEMKQKDKSKINHQLIKKHKKKFWTIIKYICDCFTSHNNFSRKFFASDAKKVAIVGMLSSLIGATIAWDSYK